MNVRFNTRIAGQPNMPLTARMRARIENFPAAVRRAEEQSGVAFVKRARTLSQGGFASKILTQMGHPYRIGGSPPHDPAIINMQSGRLASSWQFRVSPQAGEIQLTVFNTAPYAKFMLGTRMMITRPILQRVYELEQPARIQRLRYATQDVLTKIGVR